MTNGLGHPEARYPRHLPRNPCFGSVDSASTKRLLGFYIQEGLWGYSGALDLGYKDCFYRTGVGMEQNSPSTLRYRSVKNDKIYSCRGEEYARGGDSC